MSLDAGGGNEILKESMTVGSSADATEVQRRQSNATEARKAGDDELKSSGVEAQSLLVETDQLETSKLLREDELLDNMPAISAKSLWEGIPEAIMTGKSDEDLLGKAEQGKFGKLGDIIQLFLVWLGGKTGNNALRNNDFNGNGTFWTKLVKTGQKIEENQTSVSPMVSANEAKIERRGKGGESGLASLDLRPIANKYPNEASLKNNNPAGLSYFPSITSVLDAKGIEYSQGTARPSSEGYKYISFPNMEEGMKAYAAWWNVKYEIHKNGTVADMAKDWAVDTRSYQKKLGAYWNKPIESLSLLEKREIQEIQMKIESPGMYTELSQRGLTNQLDISKFA